MLFLIISYASVAQQVERTAVNRDVGGSSPLRSVFRTDGVGGEEFARIFLKVLLEKF